VISISIVAIWIDQLTTKEIKDYRDLITTITLRKIKKEIEWTKSIFLLSVKDYDPLYSIKAKTNYEKVDEKIDK